MIILQRRFALIRRYVLGVILVVPLFFAQGAQPQAATVNSDGTGFTSIDGLIVGAATYNISWTNGTYSSVFGTALFSDAAAIATEINALLNPLTPIPRLSASLGLSTFFNNEYSIPLSLGGAGIEVIFVLCGVAFTTPPLASRPLLIGVSQRAVHS